MQEGINKRKLGTNKENMAVAYLEAQGVHILERNYRCRQGEIDIIGRQGEYLIFVEVKYRQTTKSGASWEAVGITKQKKICRVADYYRLSKGLGESTSVRYDVLAIQDSEIYWLPNAFQHHYK